MSAFDIALDGDNWTADELRQFFAVASTEEIKQMNVAVLPEFLAGDMLAGLDGDEKIAAEELLFELNAFHVEQRHMIEQRFGEEVSSALDLAMQSTISSAHMQFKRRLKVLVDLYQKNRLKKSREQEEIYRPHIEALEEALGVIKDEMGAFARGSFVLNGRAQEVDGDLKSRFKTNANHLENQYGPMQRSLNLYYYVRVIMSGNEMNRVRGESSSLDGKSRILQVQINACREELLRLQEAGRLNTQQKKRETDLKQQVSGFLEDLKGYEVLISETDLVGWLDVIVEASMSEYAKSKAKQAIRTGRLELFSLLQKYCELQEAAAKQIAQNPFSQADPKKTIQFLLQSEQFILGYFARKKTSITAWLGAAAEDKIKDLGDIEGDLLAEMKQNKKKLK